MIGWAVERMTRPAIDSRRIASLNRRLKGYPRNHDYRVRGGQIVASSRLRERAASIMRMMPRNPGSFLDIGSCKGFFVLRAAALQDCPNAVGIDVHEPFVSVATDVRDYLKLPKAFFHVASLAEVANGPERLGGPFRTVQLVSTYHYLFWGSELEPTAFASHDTIMAMLERVCTRFLIFANPLEVADCPSFIQERAKELGECGYTRESFMRAADQFFDVFSIGYMDKKRKRPLLLLVNRHDSSRKSRAIPAADLVSFQSIGRKP